MTEKQINKYYSMQANFLLNTKMVEIEEIYFFNLKFETHSLILANIKKPIVKKLKEVYRFVHFVVNCINLKLTADRIYFTYITKLKDYLLKNFKNLKQ